MPLHYKHCSDCGGGPWPPQRFYRTAKRKDGSYRFTGRCRDCIKRANRENESTKPEHYKAKKRARERSPKYVQKRAEYRQSEKGRQVMRESRKAWAVCHPEKHKAAQRRWDNYRNKTLRPARKATAASQPHTTAAPAHTAE